MNYAYRSALSALVGVGLMGTFSGCSDASSNRYVNNWPDDDTLDPVALDYEPSDGHIVRVHDLIIPDDRALERLRELEVQIVAGPRTDSLGRKVVAIRSTGRLAASLGYSASGHHRKFFEPEGIPTRLLSDCSVTDFAPRYAEYSSVGPSIIDQLNQLSGSHSTVFSLGEEANGQAMLTDVGGHPIRAVAVGPVDQSIVRPETVVVLGTYHAREWASMAVVMELARIFAETANSGGSGGDVALWNLLQRTRVIFVPVVNPDGYDRSADPDPLTRNRDQRKNLHGSCSSDPGVDLNRNHRPTRREPADLVDLVNACSPVYSGPANTIEKETLAIENMYESIRHDDSMLYSKVAATISYHSYGSMILYPEGWMPPDGDGPECGFHGNCFNPDFMAYRRLFGDHEYPVFFEPLSTAPTPASSSQNLLYTTSGDVTQFATYGATPRHLAITPEITSRDVGFYIECEPNRASIVESLVANQVAMLKRLLFFLPAVTSTTPESSFFPQQLGVFAPGAIVRDDTALYDSPMYVKPIWRGLEVPPTETVTANGQQMRFLRSGAHYDLWGIEAHTLGNGCLPCSVTTEIPSLEITGPADGTPSCTVPELNCYDPTYPASGWVRDPDGGYRPTGAISGQRKLEIPGGGGALPPTSHCHLMFSTKGAPSTTSGALTLNRTSWNATTLHSWPFASTQYELRSQDRFRSELIEANRMLPSCTAANMGGCTDSFEFVVPAGTANPALKVYDPVIFCRQL